MNLFKWKKYNIITADPPWPQNDRSSMGKDGNPTKFGGGAKAHYDVDILTQEDIENLQVQNICEKNCALFLWVTLPKLPEGIDTLRKWSFQYSTVAFVWVKLNPKNSTMKSSLSKKINYELMKFLQDFINAIIKRKDPNYFLMLLMSVACFFGPGSFTASNVEICLLGTKGKVGTLKRDENDNPIFFNPKERITVQSNYISQLIFAPREKHSKKPEIFRKKIIELFGDLPRIEIFARKYPSCEGWDLIGNEVDGKDVRLALKEKIEDINNES